MMNLNCPCKYQCQFLTFTLLFLWNPLSSHGQGLFPDLVDLAFLKPVNASSTCGATSSQYCQSLKNPTSLQTCVVKTCKFDCCANCGSSKPVPTDLAARSTSQSVTQDGNPRNGSTVNSYRFQGNSYIQPGRLPGVTYANPGFSISVWIKQRAGNRG